VGGERTVLLARVLESREGLADILSDALKPFRVASLPRSAVHRAPDGATWVSTEVREGESLRWVMRTLAKQSGFIAPNEGLAVVAKVARTLDGLHRAGLAHGDLCPTSIWICADGEVALLNAAVAATLGAQGELGPFRSEMQYLAPEQVSGAPHGAADVFRLGLLLSELAMGRPLWPGPTPVHVVHAASGWVGLEREKVKQVPEPWLTLLMAMLVPNPADRPSMEEVTAILDQAITQNRWSATQNEIARLFTRAAQGGRAPLFEPGAQSPTELVLTPVGGSPSLGSLAVKPDDVRQADGPRASPPIAPPAPSPSLTPAGAVVARVAVKKMTREELAAVRVEAQSQPVVELPPELKAATALAEKGLLTRQQIETARSVSITDAVSLFSALVSFGADEDQLITTLAEQTRTPAVVSKKLLDAAPGPEGLAAIPLELSHSARAFPLGLKGSQLLVAMADPMDASALEQLKQANPNLSLVTFRAGERALAQARARHYGASELELEPQTFDPLALVRSGTSGLRADPAAGASAATAELAGRVVDALLKLNGARGAQGASLVALATDLATRGGLSPADIDLARVASGAMVACALLGNRQPWDVPKLLEVQDTVGFGSPVESFVEGLHGFPARMPERPVVRLVVLAFAFAHHAGDARPTGARVQGALNSFRTRVQLAQPLFDALSSVLS
jgi:hypothetical protein